MHFTKLSCESTVHGSEEESGKEEGCEEGGCSESEGFEVRVTLLAELSSVSTQDTIMAFTPR
jgi:hypothetical protein